MIEGPGKSYRPAVEEVEKEADAPELVMPDFYVDPAGRTDSGMEKLTKILASEMDAGVGLGELINLNDLPVSWQEHIKGRQAGGFISPDKNTFTKAEIIKATKSPDSYTPDNLIDKVFARAKKEKINFEDLPSSWQEKLKDENIFGNFTVEYLKQRGALDKDIERVKAGVQAKKVETLKEEIRKTQESFSSSVEPFIERKESEIEKSTGTKKSWWGRLKSRWGW